MHLKSFAFYIALLRKDFVAYCSERLAELGVTYGQLFILIYISKRRECSPKDICEFLKLDAGQMNRTLSKLIENDCITQRKSTKDKRANIVSLTEKGSKIVEISHSLFYQWDEKVLAGMDETNRQTLLEYMQSITLHQNYTMEEKKHEQAE